MNKYFDNQDEPQRDQMTQTSWGTKVYEMVKDMDQVEFGKKKKPPKEGPKQTRKRKRDQTEEVPAAVPFKKMSIFFKYLSYWKTLNTPRWLVLVG